MFGQVKGSPQNELTSFNPRSPYGISKLFALWICNNYREAYGMFICNGILFNHESKRRGETFVTRKITRGLSNIALGKEKCLYMGNLDAKRDWGHAKDYVEMQWLMLQEKKPDDYVIATGAQSTVKIFIEKCCHYLGLKIKWTGKGISERGIVQKLDKNKTPGIRLNQTIIRVDKKYYRPSEVHDLLGDPSKAIKKLGWKPKINLNNLIAEMIDSDLSKVKKSLQS